MVFGTSRRQINNGCFIYLKVIAHLCLRLIIWNLSSRNLTKNQLKFSASTIFQRIKKKLDGFSNQKAFLVWIKSRKFGSEAAARRLSKNAPFVSNCWKVINMGGMEIKPSPISNTSDSNVITLNFIMHAWTNGLTSREIVHCVKERLFTKNELKV